MSLSQSVPSGLYHPILYRLKPIPMTRPRSAHRTISELKNNFYPSFLLFTLSYPEVLTLESVFSLQKAL